MPSAPGGGMFVAQVVGRSGAFDSGGSYCILGVPWSVTAGQNVLVEQRAVAARTLRAITP